MYIQKDIAQWLVNREKSGAAEKLLEKSKEFIQAAEQRKLSINDYPGYVKEVLPQLKECVLKIAGSGVLLKQLSQLEEKLSDPRALQKAHLTFLLQLRNSLKLVKK